MIRRLKAWWRSHKSKAASNQLLELREFVYLDEVSVTSLLSSRIGAIPSEFTDTLTDSIKAELNSGLEASTPVVKAKLGSRFESTRSQNFQVLRKATIQATFKDLYDREKGALALHRISPDERVPEYEELRSRFNSSDCNKGLSPWLIRGSQLRRGQLAEIEVELQADPLFRSSSIISTFTDIVKDSTALGDSIDQETLRQVTEINQLLEHLMAGLVPIKCRVIDYDVVVIDSEEYLANRRVLSFLSDSERATARPLCLVGVAEQTLFWKDIRRVLFSEARVRALCRLNYDGVRSSWVPVKLADVLKDVDPTLADRIRMLGTDVFQMSSGNQGVGMSPIEPGHAALLAYAELLAAEHGQVLEDQLRSRVHEVAQQNSEYLGAVAESLPAFTEIAKLVEEELGRSVDPDTAVRLRMEAREQAGLVDPGEIAQATTEPEKNFVSERNERFLDAEIIAVYW